MDGLWTRRVGWIAIGLTACLAEESAQGDDAFADGGFESTVAPDAGILPLVAGQAFSSWTVIGAGHVAVVNGDVFRDGTWFGAAAGRQWIDLAGASGASEGGVQQVVTTTPGRSYRLRFAVGNVVNPAAGFGRSSTVIVRVNGALVLRATNSEGRAGALSWKHFDLAIVPTTTRTTIAFINGDPADDHSNGLDAVSLVPVMPDDED